MPIFADFEAFQHGVEPYKIKELCLLSTEQPFTPLYFLFTPPHAWDELDNEQQRTYTYSTRKLHGLQWDEGKSRFCRECVVRAIESSFPMHTNDIFYVMGEQKMQALRHMFPTFNWTTYNITAARLPTIGDNIQCVYKPHAAQHCACLKCYRLCQHYLTLPIN